MKRNIKQVMEAVDVYVKDGIIVKNRNGVEGIEYTSRDVITNRLVVIEEGNVSNIYHNGACLFRDLYL